MEEEYPGCPENPECQLKAPPVPAPPLDSDCQDPETNMAVSGRAGVSRTTLQPPSLLTGVISMLIAQIFK